MINNISICAPILFHLIGMLEFYTTVGNVNELRNFFQIQIGVFNLISCNFFWTKNLLTSLVCCSSVLMSETTTWIAVLVQSMIVWAVTVTLANLVNPVTIRSMMALLQPQPPVHQVFSLFKVSHSLPLSFQSESQSIFVFSRKSQCILSFQSKLQFLFLFKVKSVYFCLSLSIFVYSR